MRNWERPMVVVDTFAANEFVSSCGKNHKVYNFECNAGNEYKHYDVFTSDGRNLTPGNGYRNGGSYHPCHKTHQAEEDSGFIKGFMVDNDGNDQLTYDKWSFETWSLETYEYPKTDVIIWTNNNTNVHCTTNLNMKQWTTAKS